MRKILSLLLVTCLLLSCSATVLADGHSTKVRYVGEGESEWKLNVPIQLAPKESGNVILTGTWDTNTIVNVTADETVTLSNDVDDTTKTLGITFESISQEGNMDDEITVTKPISVAEMSGGLFGTWEGIFNYYVTVESVESVEPVEPELIEFTVSDLSGRIKTFQAEKGMTWKEWLESEYNTEHYYGGGVSVNQGGPAGYYGEYVCIQDCVLYDEDLVSVEEYIKAIEYSVYDTQSQDGPSPW